MVERLGWVDLTAAAGVDTLALLVLAAVASYLMGHLTYDPGPAL